MLSRSRRSTSDLLTINSTYSEDPATAEVGPVSPGLRRPARPRNLPAAILNPRIQYSTLAR
jgi:hypothetical protein